MTFTSCTLSSFVEFCSAVLEKKLKMHPQISGKGGQLGFLIGHKKTNFIEDIEKLLAVKFR